MDSPWFVLSGRYGGDTVDPSVDELRRALTEVYVENHPALTHADYEEHPSALVRYGTDTGPMYVMYVDRSHSVRLEQWTDQDYGDELSSPLTIERVTCEEAFGLWSQLRSGHVEELCRQFEKRGRAAS